LENIGDTLTEDKNKNNYNILYSPSPTSSPKANITFFPSEKDKIKLGLSTPGAHLKIPAFFGFFFSSVISC
jgi:hypothetical protein